MAAKGMATTMEECVFCRIARREMPASVVTEDEDVMAFMDIVPINPGHTLVIPKIHYAVLEELPPDIGAEMFRMALRINQALRQSDIPCAGTNLLLSNGRAAGQEVFHLHLHVIPRLIADGSGFRFNSKNRSKPGRKMLDSMALKIKESM
jgi:histidine triad (HIT) family protein